MVKRHPDKALTAIKVKNASKPGRYADGNGLYLLVDPSGAKRWILRTVVQGRRRDFGLGSTRLVSLADARVEAEEMRRQARRGGDPSNTRRKPTAPTFAEAARRVYSERKSAWKSAVHARQWITSLEEYAFPVLGDKRVDEIGTPDVLRALTPYWMTKVETARRLKQRIEVVLDWATASGHRTGENPVQGVDRGLPPQPSKRRHFEAIPYTELPRLVADLKAGNTETTPALALEFLILTAARTKEVLGAKWDEIDEKNATWSVPAERMKAGKLHRVPLAPRALQILHRAQALLTNDYVFPGARTQRPLGDSALLAALRDVDQNCTVHGFRSAFRDWAAECTSFPRDVCEMALAHTIKNKAEAAYRRGDMLERRRVLMTEWADFVGGEN